MNGLAFFIAYRARLLTEHEQLAPFSVYAGMLGIQLAVVLVVFVFFGLYRLPRARTRLDEVYSVFAAVLVGILITIALASLMYGNDLDYSRLMMLYDWVLTFVFVSGGRALA